MQVVSFGEAPASAFLLVRQVPGPVQPATDIFRACTGCSLACDAKRCIMSG